MKNKLPEKLTAILLVFAMAFLTVPFVKAEVIISLECNLKLDANYDVEQVIQKLL